MRDENVMKKVIIDIKIYSDTKEFTTTTKKKQYIYRYLHISLVEYLINDQINT